MPDERERTEPLASSLTSGCRGRDWRRNRLRGETEWWVLVVADLTLFPHGGVVIQKGPSSSPTRTITLKRTRWGTRRESLGWCWSSGKHRSRRLLGSQGEVDLNKPDCMEDKIDSSRNEVSLELVQVDIEGTIKAEGRGDRRDNLRNQSVQVCKARLCDVEVVLVDVIDSSIVNLKSLHQRRNHRHRKATKRYMQ